RIPQIVERLGVGRIERQRLSVVLGRLVMASEQLQRVAEIVVSLGISRAQRERLSISLHGLFEALHTGKRDRKMVVGIGRSFGELYGAAKQRLRFGEPALLQPKNAKAINAIEMTHIDGDNGLVEYLRLAQTPLRVQRGRLLECSQRIKPCS